MVNDDDTQPPPAEGCPDGRLRPSDIAGYLRAEALENIKIPDIVLAHVRVCDACARSWELVRLHDNALKRHRRQRAVTIVRRLRAVDDWSKSSSERLGAQQRELVLQSVTEDLLGEKLPVPNVLGLGWREIVERCHEVQFISNERERLWQAVALSNAFESRLSQDSKANQFAFEFARDTKESEIVIVGIGTILAEPGEIAIAVNTEEQMNAIACFAGSITAVSYVNSEPRLLERRGELLVFRAGEALRREPEVSNIESKMLLAATRI